VQDAPRYGAERRGAPIVSYVRAARCPINDRGAIADADLVVVADETLVPMPAAGVLFGLSPRTVLFINTTVSAHEWRRRLAFAGPSIAAPLGEAAETSADAAFIGVACAGAAARLLGVVGREALERSVREEVAKFSPRAADKSMERALAAYDAMAERAGIVTQGKAASAADHRRPDWIDVPAVDVSLAAPDITRPATSKLTNTGTWRIQRPVIDYALCNRCSWICATLCPDSAIDVAADRTPRIDYDHCKGCMVCVAICPSHAIRAERESHGLAVEV
jgi:pyruvate ferredoxin oxidoreductase gamma subunit